ncbi:helix-turn-helix domain-containing protein [Candidatus Daviesbacteria bacterium]|nr:helix-turn-helix domain-containing protein [Candidatus Daviesbacteria bacterium]
MRTVGTILKEAREAKFYSLEDIEKNTKIRKELLEALESDNFEKLPPSTFVQGFIKNYGKFLNLNTDKLLAIFRRDYEAAKHPPQVMESLSNPVGNKQVIITPQRVIASTIVLIIIGFFIYLWVAYRQFVGAPELMVSSPKDQQSVEIPSIVVEGKTDPDAKVAVNNQEIGVDKSGNFREEVKLSSSVNTILITSTSKFGQSSKIERTVFVKK